MVFPFCQSAVIGHLSNGLHQLRVHDDVVNEPGSLEHVGTSRGLAGLVTEIKKNATDSHLKLRDHGSSWLLTPPKKKNMFRYYRLMIIRSFL